MKNLPPKGDRGGAEEGRGSGGAGEQRAGAAIRE